MRTLQRNSLRSQSTWRLKALRGLPFSSSCFKPKQTVGFSTLLSAICFKSSLLLISSKKFDEDTQIFASKLKKNIISFVKLSTQLHFAKSSVQKKTFWCKKPRHRHRKNWLTYWSTFSSLPLIVPFLLLCIVVAIYVVIKYHKNNKSFWKLSRLTFACFFEQTLP